MTTRPGTGGRGEAVVGDATRMEQEAERRAPPLGQGVSGPTSSRVPPEAGGWRQGSGTARGQAAIQTGTQPVGAGVSGSKKEDAA